MDTFKFYQPTDADRALMTTFTEHFPETDRQQLSRSKKYGKMIEVFVQKKTLPDYLNEIYLEEDFEVIVNVLTDFNNMDTGDHAAFYEEFIKSDIGSLFERFAESELILELVVTNLYPYQENQENVVERLTFELMTKHRLTVLYRKLRNRGVFNKIWNEIAYYEMVNGPFGVQTEN
jgi:hypothetical protein